MTNGPGSPETPLTRRSSGQALERPTDAVHRFVLRRFTGHVLDVEDVHFNHDSAVLLPDFGDCGAGGDEADLNRVTGLGAVRAVHLHAEAHPDQKMLIAGHTDRSGGDAYNLELSQMRGDNVLHILTGNRDEWVRISKKKHKVADYQQILKWVDTIWGWGCDPGEVDGVQGSRTRSATRTFQKQYNIDFGKSIAEDGEVGTETWGAFFDVYMRVLMFVLEVDEAGLARRQASLKFLDDGKKAVGCGENFPLTANTVANRRSRVDRRVEVLFFDPGEEPFLECHPGPGRCVADDCEIYDRAFFRLDPIPCLPVPRPVPTWVVRLLKAGSGPPGDHEPLADTPFTLSGAGSGEISDTTDADGILRVPVQDDPCTMILKIAGMEMALEAGSLIPLDDGDDGVRQRLSNLGYGPERLLDWTDAVFESSLKRFQKDHDLEESGAADDATRGKLKEVHGG